MPMFYGIAFPCRFPSLVESRMGAGSGLVIDSDVAEQIGHGLAVVDSPDGFWQDQTDIHSLYLGALQLLHLVRNSVGHYHLCRARKKRELCCWTFTLPDSRRGVYCCSTVQGEKSFHILGKKLLKNGLPPLWQSVDCHITSTLQQADGSTQITGSITKVWNPVLFMYQQPLTSWGRGAEQWDGRHTIREGSVQAMMTNIFVREKIHSGKQIWSEQVLITHNYFFFCSNEEPTNWKHLIKWVIPDMSYVPWEGHQFANFGASPQCAVWRADSPHQWRIPLWDGEHRLTGAHE